jgi:acyl carrier protein
VGPGKLQTNMQDAHFEQLERCFERVFPGLDRSSIPADTQDSVAAWDSIAQVTLIALIGEDFGIDIDFEDFEDATSFAAILDVVRARVPNG